MQLTLASRECRQYRDRIVQKEIDVQERDGSRTLVFFNLLELNILMTVRQGRTRACVTHASKDLLVLLHQPHASPVVQRAARTSQTAA